MFFKFKPTKIRTRGRLPQTPKNKIKLKKRSPKLNRSGWGQQSLVRA